jgi:hypothetical protein
MVTRTSGVLMARSWSSGSPCGSWLKSPNSTSILHLDGHPGSHRWWRRNYTSSSDANSKGSCAAPLGSAPKASRALRAFGGLPGVTYGDAPIVAEALNRVERGTDSADALHPDRRCCTTLMLQDSRRESMRLGRVHEQADARPLPQDELVRLHGFAAQARFAADLAGHGHGLTHAA